MAALTLLAVALPEQLATARLAGMPPLTGLYAFIAASVGFALAGRNARLSVGADSTIAPLIAAGVAGVVASGAGAYRDLVPVLAVLVGVMVTLVGLLRLGWLALLLSEPIVTGFLAGVAAIIVLHQLPDLLGLPAPGGTTVHRVVFVAGHLGRVHWWSLGLGSAGLAVILAGERVDRRIPGALVALVASTAAVPALHLTRHGVDVIGPIGRGGPSLGVHGVTLVGTGRLLPLAAVVALVVVTQTAATTRAFPPADREQKRADRDFVGVGLGSVLAGAIGSFAVDASPPRTAVVVEAGGRTKLVSVAAAVAMAALLPAAGLLTHVPLTTLAAVLLFVASRIVHVGELRAIARFSRFELALALVTALTVAVVGVEQGIVVAAGLAILGRVRLDAAPDLHVMGRVPGTTSWAPLSSPEPTVQEPGILVVLFATPLWYANAVHFRTEMTASLRRARGPLRAVVIDVLGMNNIDFTGARALVAVLDELQGRGITVAVARAAPATRVGFDRAGISGRIGPAMFFETVGEAAAAVGASPPAPPG